MGTVGGLRHKGGQCSLRGWAGVEWDAPTTWAMGPEEATSDIAGATVVGDRPVHDHTLKVLPQTKVSHEEWGSEETHHVVADRNCSVLTSWWGPGKLRRHRIYQLLIFIINYFRNKFLRCFHILQEFNDDLQLKLRIVYDLSWYTQISTLCLEVLLKNGTLDQT